LPENRRLQAATIPRPIRRADRALSEVQAREILQKDEYGVLSTVSSDGQPYGVPVSFAYANGSIYFHCAVDGHKLDNVNANSRVSFCVVGEAEVLPDKFATRYESAIVFGQAGELTGEAKRAALTEILKKYSPDFMEKGKRYIKSDIQKVRVFKIEVDVLSGKARR
jgi:nitroimidazol reductase NimA-like FMN-containing flavoprotein (pyridoxamine 5'-phosphate oxidase superfamily)